MKFLYPLALLLAALAGSLLAQPAHAAPISSPYGPAYTTSPIDHDAAPLPYHGDNTSSVSFVGNPNEVCGPAEPGTTILACFSPSNREMTLPNPCTHDEYKDEEFAQLVCHELGHLNGWPGDHPRPIAAP